MRSKRIGSPLELGEIAAAAIDAFPSPVLLVDDDVRILAWNEAAAELLGEGSEAVLRRAGDALHCISSLERPEGCGRGKACSDCVIRNAVQGSCAGRRTVRRKAYLELLVEGKSHPVYFLVTASPVEHQGQRYTLLVLEDISDLMEIRSMLSVCCFCKRVREGVDGWDQLESYFRKHLDLDFSHTICPECMHEHYREFIDPA